MLQVVFELIFEYGAFPGVVIYLLYVILKEQKGELQTMKNTMEKGFEKLQDNANHQNKSINEMVGVMRTMHNIMANQMHSLVMKIIEGSQKSGGDK